MAHLCLTLDSSFDGVLTRLVVRQAHIAGYGSYWTTHPSCFCQPSNLVERKRSAFAMTLTDDKAMAAAATAGDSRPGTHGNANLGGCQRRSVVDTVASHGDHAPILLQLLNHCCLVCGKNLGTH
jgi:hypothetical protein